MDFKLFESKWRDTFDWSGVEDRPFAGNLAGDCANPPSFK